MPKKIKNEGRLARMARTVKMLVKGKRYKMSRKAQKEQEELGKKKKETFASTLVSYPKPRKKPPGLTQAEWDRMNKKKK